MIPLWAVARIGMALGIGAVLLMDAWAGFLVTFFYGTMVLALIGCFPGGDDDV